MQIYVSIFYSLKLLTDLSINIFMTGKHWNWAIYIFSCSFSCFMFTGFFKKFWRLFCQKKSGFQIKSMQKSILESTRCFQNQQCHRYNISACLRFGFPTTKDMSFEKRKYLPAQTSSLKGSFHFCFVCKINNWTIDKSVRKRLLLINRFLFWVVEVHI